jgi:hypothetical protein
MHGALLMSGQYKLNILLVMKKIENVKHNTSGISEHVLNALFSEGLQENLCARYFHDLCSSVGLAERPNFFKFLVILTHKKFLVVRILFRKNPLRIDDQKGEDRLKNTPHSVKKN